MVYIKDVKQRTCGPQPDYQRVQCLEPSLYFVEVGITKFLTFFFNCKSVPVLTNKITPSSNSHLFLVDIRRLLSYFFY